MTAGQQASARASDEPVIRVSDLVVEVESSGLRILDGVSFDVRRGRALGILGETGSGKSMTLRSILGLLPRGLAVAGGTINFGDLDMLALSARATRTVRGKRIGFIPQQPTQALNPVLPIRAQFIRLARARGRAQVTRALSRAAELLNRVGLSDHERVLSSYAGELSGGMAQRVAIAMALYWDPEIIVADEPTTALDLTVQKEILNLLSRVVVAEGRALVIVTHDLGVVSHYCDDTVVLSKGQVVERGAVHATLNNPKTEYVRRLIDATRAKPRASRNDTDQGDPILELRDVSKTFTRRAQRVDAMKHVSLAVNAGRTLGVIGESGSGKSTTGMTILGRVEPDSGDVIFRFGEDTTPTRLGSAHDGVSVVFQNPHDALNPRMTVGASVLEPLEIQFSHWSSAQRKTAAKDALRLAQLDPDLYWGRYPRSLSGGQQQRVTVARAIATRPRLIVLDEPTASLDASVRAALLDTLEQVQNEVGTAYFLISHDIATIARLSDRVVVMHHGEIVEKGQAQAVLDSPSDPYTRSLLSAALEIQTEGGESPAQPA